MRALIPCLSATKALCSASGLRMYRRYMFSTSSPTNGLEMLSRINKLSSTMLGANWADYLNMVVNLSFWESELEILEQNAKNYADNSEIQDQLSEVQKIADCLIRSTDIRDHLNEVMEHSSRHAGVAGTGINAADNVDNLQDHSIAASQLYDQLLIEYPTLTPKINETLGSALVLMRQKNRFHFTKQHQFFF